MTQMIQMPISILSLPGEILLSISAYLTNRSIKALRLSNKRLQSVSPLSFSRVFISPSAKNIEVFLAVASHEKFKDQVREIIWDDTRFDKCLDFYDDTGEAEEFNEFAADDFQCWLMDDDGEVPERAENAVAISEKKSRLLYQRLYAEQEEIISQGQDMDAFRMGLSAFTNLQRLTVTSEVYRPTYPNQRYITPLVRSFPVGFIYPLPWPGEYTSAQADSLLAEGPWEDIRSHWRGLCIVCEELAAVSLHTKIPELVIDVNYETVGIPRQFFEETSADYKSFKTVCSNGIRRLGLALNVSTPQFTGWQTLRSGLLKSALETCGELQHFAFVTSANTRALNVGPMFHAEDCVPLQDTFQISSWPSLQTFSLSNHCVKLPDLMSFLALLPKTIKSLEFVNLELFDGTWQEALQCMKTTLGFTRDHPTIRIANELSVPSNKVWIEREVGEFFGGGENPFTGTYGGNEIQLGYGVVRDDFDEDFRDDWVPDLRTHVKVAPGVWEEVGSRVP